MTCCLRSNYPIIQRTSHQMNKFKAFHMGLYSKGTRDIIYWYILLQCARKTFDNSTYKFYKYFN